MIQNKQEYKYYLSCDKKALGVSDDTLMLRIKLLLFPNYIWNFQKILRKSEYYKNCKKDLFGRVLYLYYKKKLNRYGLRLGFSIPENVFGPGLAIVHYGSIVVNGAARVGKNCRIHASTNIGASGGSKKAPIIGDNVYIGPGAIIFGEITVGNNNAISANATVNKTIEEENKMIAGTPAKVIKDIDIKRIIPNAE
ncbi:serine O-acetyltransferase [Sphingobacterium siyangense]|uniref:serine O-acetyltransferase n=1 Tax=Sphingobacterium siyangense TaxID=459529 RepID=UPI003DA47DFD